MQQKFDIYKSDLQWFNISVLKRNETNWFYNKCFFNESYSTEADPEIFKWEGVGWYLGVTESMGHVRNGLLGMLQFENRPFARSGHMVLNHTCW